MSEIKFTLEDVMRAFDGGFEKALDFEEVLDLMDERFLKWERDMEFIKKTINRIDRGIKKMSLGKSYNSTNKTKNNPTGEPVKSKQPKHLS